MSLQSIIKAKIQTIKQKQSLKCATRKLNLYTGGFGALWKALLAEFRLDPELQTILCAEKEGYFLCILYSRAHGLEKLVTLSQIQAEIQ